MHLHYPFDLGHSSSKPSTSQKKRRPDAAIGITCSAESPGGCNALAEGDLTDRARQRAHQIARDADLRVIAPKGFFHCENASIEPIREGPPRDQRLPMPGTLLSRKWKDRTILVEVLDRGFRYDNRRYSSLLC